MATKVVVCPECESTLIPGRFSCSSCGTLLASVASDARSFAAPPPVVPPALDHPLVALEPEPAPSNGHEPADDAEPDDDAPLALAPVAADVVADPAEEPAAVMPALPPEVVSELQHEPEPVPELDVPEAAAASVPAVADPGELGWQVAPEPAVRAEWATSAVAASAAVAPAGAAAPATAWPAQPSWPPAPEPPVPVEPAPRTPAGSYLPPSAVLPPGEALPVNGTATGTARGEGTQKRSLAERFTLGEDDGPLGLPAEVPGRTIALGAAIAGLGFLLPWADIVIGSASMGGFLDQWGLAAPGHALLLLALIVVGGLAVLRERTEVKVGTSTAAIFIGAVLIGIAFPYLMGPFREAVGVYVALAGALMLIAGGLLARAAPRHDPERAAV